MRIITSLTKRELYAALSWGGFMFIGMHFWFKGFEFSGYFLTNWVLMAFLWLGAGLAWMHGTKKVSQMMKDRSHD